MPRNEFPPEKRIAAALDVPETPPVHPEHLLNNPGPVETLGEPPQTRLLLEGFDPGEITAEFLVGIHDLGDECKLPVDSISVGHPDNR